MGNQVLDIARPPASGGSGGGDPGESEPFTGYDQQATNDPAIRRRGARQYEGESEEEQRKPAAIAKENRTHLGGESQLGFTYRVIGFQGHGEKIVRQCSGTGTGFPSRLIVT
jgi:hypothetical protein